MNILNTAKKFRELSDDNSREIIITEVANYMRTFIAEHAERYIGCEDIPFSIEPFVEAGISCLYECLSDYNESSNIPFEMFIKPYLNRAMSKVLETGSTIKTVNGTEVSCPPAVTNENLIYIYRNTKNSMRKSTILDILIARNDKFIQKCINHYSSDGSKYNRENFLQEARLAMVESIITEDKDASWFEDREGLTKRDVCWDESKGTFLTFIYPHITQALGEVARSEAGLSRHQYNMINKYNRVIRNFNAKNIEYTADMLCEELNIKLSALVAIRSNITRMNSIVRIDDPDIQAFPQASSDNPEEAFANNELKRSVRNAIRHIAENGGEDGELIAQIITCSSGIDCPPMSHVQIAKMLNNGNKQTDEGEGESENQDTVGKKDDSNIITPSRVSQLRNAGISLLRHSPLLAQYNDFGDKRLQQLESFANNIVLSFVSPEATANFMTDLGMVDFDNDEIEVTICQPQSAITFC